MTSFSDSINNTPRSFIREILNLASQPDIISFAGGLPNPDLFPISDIKHFSESIFNSNSSEVFQYSSTAGYLPLREYIASEYSSKSGIAVSPEEILITTGSQQGIDLISKVFINKNDNVLIEDPGYIGAIQAFSFYGANLEGIPITSDGLNIEFIKNIVSNNSHKFLYCIPRFQNPSGICYTEDNKFQISDILKDSKTLIVEDSPYEKICFDKVERKYFFEYHKETITLGSFSKIIVPGFRIGWIYASKENIDKLTLAKQFSDLHSSSFDQRLIFEYLKSGKLSNHLLIISERYKFARDIMADSIKKYFPEGVSFTEPSGGMFFWVTLPGNIDSNELLKRCINRGVTFVPGVHFKLKSNVCSSLRLNFSCTSGKKIEEGIKIIGDEVKKLL